MLQIILGLCRSYDIHGTLQQYLGYIVVWKIFVWNYFVAGNVRENNFHGLPIPTKIF